MISGVKKLIYFSDGATEQYIKIKAISSIFLTIAMTSVQQAIFLLQVMENDHAIGIGGTIKRLAARSSLQLPIWGYRKSETFSIGLGHSKCIYVDEHRDHQKELESLFELAKIIKGTLKNYFFMPINREQIEMREFSLASNILLLL